MNTRRHIITVLMVVSIIAAACGCRTRPICILYGVPHTFSATEVAGLWMGFTTTDTDLYRLELRTDSTGVLTQAYTSMTNQETLRFEISRWDIATNNVLTCSFAQHDVHEPVIMTCQVRGDRLEALLRNGEGGWKESIVYWREKDLDEKLRVIRQ
jgi:hypothetical protein